MCRHKYVRLITDCRQRSLHTVTKCTMPALRCPFFLSPLSSERYLQIEVPHIQDNMSSGVKSFIHKRCQLLLIKVKYRVHSVPFIQALFPDSKGHARIAFIEQEPCAYVFLYNPNMFIIKQLSTQEHSSMQT